MITFYKTPKDERDGLGIWISAFTFEDMYFTTLDNKEEKNNKRWKRFGIFITFLLWEIEFRISLKHVGAVYYGREIKKLKKIKK